MTGQIDLLGGPDIPTQRPVPPDDRPPTNDLDLIAAVVKTAQETGYVVIGPTERVYRRNDTDPKEIERVPEYENGAVHQLLDKGLLTIGGGHTVTYHGKQGRANAVLVPKRTASMVKRWEAYKPLPR